MPSPGKSLMILVAGPYRSGTNDDRQRIAAEVARDLEQTIARLHMGLEILGVSLTEARPPAEVATEEEARS